MSECLWQQSTQLLDSINSNSNQTNKIKEKFDKKERNNMDSKRQFERGEYYSVEYHYIPFKYAKHLSYHLIACGTVCLWNMNFRIRFFFSISWAFALSRTCYFFFSSFFFMFSVYPWHQFKLGVKMLPCFIINRKPRIEKKTHIHNEHEKSKKKPPQQHWSEKNRHHWTKCDKITEEENNKNIFMIILLNL